jgi:hypothetical protein
MHTINELISIQTVITCTSTTVNDEVQEWNNNTLKVSCADVEKIQKYWSN